MTPTHPDRYALYVLDTRDPAQWELLGVSPSRGEAEAEAAVVAQHERTRATRVLAFAAAQPIPHFLDNTTGDRDAQALSRRFALFDPDDDAPRTEPARPPQEEHR